MTLKGSKMLKNVCKGLKGLEKVLKSLLFDFSI